MLRSSGTLRLIGPLLATAALLAGCGGDGADSADTATPLVELLPEDGELGPGWTRLSDPRPAGPEEAARTCGVDLNTGMSDGAKAELVDDAGNIASMFFRRYASADAADDALVRASERIAGCPPGGLGAGVVFEVTALPPPDAGERASAALFSIPATPTTAAERFGWTLVRTGAVIRSVQFLPATTGAAKPAALVDLARGVAESG